MQVSELKSVCDQYHENMWDWLLEDILGKSLSSSNLRLLSNSLDKRDLKGLIKGVACGIPGRFGETFFRNRPEFSKYKGLDCEPWRFYPDQWDAINYTGDMLIVGGAGTGKTRLFACKGLHIVAFKKASVLVITHSETARSQIFNEMCYQIRNSPFLRELFPKEKISKGNIKSIECVNPAYGSIRFCLSGKGDTIFAIQIGRGGYLLLDEAARYRREAWEAIMSRGRRGCRVIAASVPYGMKGNKFEQLVRSGIDLSLMKLASVRELDQNVEKTKSFPFAVVYWDKEKQPDWSKEEEVRAIRDHGSKEGWEYRVYVKGMLSDPEGQVFQSDHLESVFVSLPIYKSLRVVWDVKTKSVRCSVMCPSGSDGYSRPMLCEMVSEIYDFESFNFIIWLLENIPNVPVDVAGIDAGKIQDPHVMLAFGDMGTGLRLQWSLVTMYVPYTVQIELIADMILQDMFEYGIGIEASGANIASSIWEGLIWQHKIPEERFSPYSWQTKVTLLREDGKTQRDQSRHEIKRSLKHHITVRMKDFFMAQHEGISGSFELPESDTVMRREFTEHSGQHIVNDFRYGEDDDHFIEAARVALGRYLDYSGASEIIEARKEAVERLTIPRHERRASV